MDEAASKLRLEMDSLPGELDELNRKLCNSRSNAKAIRREKDKHKEAILIRKSPS